MTDWINFFSDGKQSMCHTSDQQHWKCCKGASGKLLAQRLNLERSLQVQRAVRSSYGCHELAERTDLCSVPLIPFRKLGKTSECIRKYVSYYLWIELRKFFPKLWPLTATKYGHILLLSPHACDIVEWLKVVETITFYFHYFASHQESRPSGQSPNPGAELWW